MSVQKCADGFGIRICFIREKASIFKESEGRSVAPKESPRFNLPVRTVIDHQHGRHGALAGLTRILEKGLDIIGLQQLVNPFLRIGNHGPNLVCDTIKPDRGNNAGSMRMNTCVHGGNGWYRGGRYCGKDIGVIYKWLLAVLTINQRFKVRQSL